MEGIKRRERIEKAERMIEIKQRKIHPEQRSTNESLKAAQLRLLWEFWSNELEIYDSGELIAITAKDNPNLAQLLDDLGYFEPGNHG